MTTRTSSPRALSTAAGDRVIDLTQNRAPDPRIVDYQQAFGLPSPLHHRTLREVVSKLGLARLRSLVARRGRH